MISFQQQEIRSCKKRSPRFLPLIAKFRNKSCKWSLSLASAMCKNSLNSFFVAKEYIIELLMPNGIKSA